MTCPQCGEPTDADDAFCENCGAALKATSPDPATSSGRVRKMLRDRTHDTLPHAYETAPSRACAACGGEVGDDGWCTVCGSRASNGREHVVEQPSPTVAGVSDKGRAAPAQRGRLRAGR